MVAYLLSPNRCHWWIAKVKNYNLNVTENLDSDFKKCFSRNFQFHRRDPIWKPKMSISILYRPVFLQSGVLGPGDFNLGTPTHIDELHPLALPLAPSENP